MEKLNFIKTVPETRKKEVHRWFFFSLIMIGGLVFYIGASSITYIYLYYRLPSLSFNESHYRQLQADYAAKESSFKNERHTFEKLYSYQHNPKNPLNLLSSITSICGAQHLQSFKFNQNTCDITLTIPSVKKAHHYLQQIEKIPKVKNARLVALQKRENNLINASYQLAYEQKKSQQKAGSKQSHH